MSRKHELQFDLAALKKLKQLIISSKDENSDGKLKVPSFVQMTAHRKLPDVRGYHDIWVCILKTKGQTGKQTKVPESTNKF